MFQTRLKLSWKVNDCKPLGDGGALPNITLGTWPLCECCGMVYNGYLDHVRIWTARLPGAAIRDWREQVFGALHPFASDLAASWLLDETQGRGLPSSTIHLNLGTFYGIRKVVLVTKRLTVSRKVDERKSLTQGNYASDEFRRDVGMQITSGQTAANLWSAAKFKQLQRKAPTDVGESAGAYTRPLFSSTLSVPDTEHTLYTP